jgi:hypothetical protein
VTPDIILPQSNLIIPIIPLDSHFHRIRVRRENSSIDEFHQILEFTTVVELKLVLFPDISPKQILLSYNGTKLLEDFQPVSDILIGEPQLFYVCKSPPDNRFMPLISSHPKSSSGQYFNLNENEWIFHFEREEDAIFRFDSEATIGDAQSVLSNAWQIFFPPFALYDVEDNELHNRNEFLQSISHEITIRRSTSQSSCFHMIFPSGEWQSMTRKPFQDLRSEIGRQLGHNIDLIWRGQFVFDDIDIEDSPLFVCIRSNDQSTSLSPPQRLIYQFDVAEHGLMTFEPSSPISIEFAQNMFAYLTESQSITLSVNRNQLRNFETLPLAPDTIDVTF